MLRSMSVRQAPYQTPTRARGVVSGPGMCRMHRAMHEEGVLRIRRYSSTEPWHSSTDHRPRSSPGGNREGGDTCEAAEIQPRAGSR